MEDEYIITLNAGTGGYVSPSIYSETDYPLGFSLPLPTFSGKIFLGWSLDNISAVGMDGDTYAVTSTQTLYALWRDEYIITLNAGTEGYVSPSSYSETDYPLGFSLPLPTFSGKLFLGWSTSNDISDSVGTDGDTYAITSSQILYALWRDINVITLNANGGTVSPSSYDDVSNSTFLFPYLHVREKFVLDGQLQLMIQVLVWVYLEKVIR